MFFLFPALWAAFFGILGEPSSWTVLLQSAWAIFEGKGPVGAALAFLGTAAQVLFFHPFPCPEILQWIPAWLQLFLFRQPEQVFPPPQAQMDKAKVKDEYWIYVNGVANTADVAKANANDLYRMVSRPIWLCHNPTDGLLVDLLECIVGKVGYFDWFWETKPELCLQDALTDALTSGKYKRVVVVCHSQGTIITSNALKYLASRAEDARLMQQYLEVYAFANCSQQMLSDDVKYLENLSNGCDTVAYLGALFPFPSFFQDKYGNGICITGEQLEEPMLWGHMLYSHYLRPMMSSGHFADSRLQRYRREVHPVGTALKVR
jgi:hypothetical protein